MLRHGAFVSLPFSDRMFTYYVLNISEPLPFTERDSPRDQMIVTLFLLVVIGLLIGAAIKTRMEMIGVDTSEAWSSGRAWWEVS